MNEIICPHCKKAFKIDEAGYADILKQVHDKEFDQQLNDRLQIAEREKRSEVELAKAKVTSEFEKRAAEKEATKAPATAKKLTPACSGKAK